VFITPLPSPGYCWRIGTVSGRDTCGSVRPSVRPFSLKLSDLLNVRTTKCTNTVDGCACCASRWRFCCSVCDLCLAVSLSLSVCVCVCVCLCLPVTYGVCAQLRTATAVVKIDCSKRLAFLLYDFKLISNQQQLISKIGTYVQSM